MDFNDYSETPVYNDDNTVAYYQLEMNWKEN